MLVDVELDRVIGSLEAPAVGVESNVPVCHGSDLEGLDVDGHNGKLGTVADVQRQPVYGQRLRQRGAGHVDVVTAVEFDAVGTVHLSPSCRSIGSQPQVGLVEIAEQQELADLPRCRQPQHVLHLLASNLTADRPALVLPAELGDLGDPAADGVRRVVGAALTPCGPPHRVAAGGQRGVVAHSRNGTVRDVISEHEARQHVLDRCGVGEVIEASLADAIGCVLAEAVVAAEDVPPFANSAVDGYAVRAIDVADVPVRLRVVAEVAAGWSTDCVVGRGEAIRIMTGAPMPDGADAVVMVEDTERLDGGEVLIRSKVVADASVRGIGDDVHAGTRLFDVGTVVRPAVAGVLASVNARRVRVVRRAHVAVLSTGDELINDGSALRPGQIRESNKTMLLPLIAEAGCEAIDLGVVRDDEAALEAVLRDAAATHDAIVTSGGVSMGEFDVVKAVLSRIADMRWMQIAIKPAKPFAFGLLASGGRRVPVFGLPGNPVSSMVSFELFARPALRKMMGHTVLERPTIAAVADDGLPRRIDGKTHYMRVSGAFGLDGRYHISSVGAQGSHQLAATSLADAMAIVPDGDGVAPGGSVTTMLLSIA